jgi:hypothetical protein
MLRHVLSAHYIFNSTVTLLLFTALLIGAL